MLRPRALRAWRKDRHLKRPLCVRVSDGAHAIVKALQLDERISQAAIVEVMLRKEARTRRYKLLRKGLAGPWQVSGTLAR